MPTHIRTARPSGDIRGFPHTVVLSGGVEAGKIIKIEDTFAVIFQDKALGEDVAAHYHVEKIMLEKAAVAINKGQKLYHDGTYGNPVTNVYASGLYWIAIAVEDADADDTHVKADLKGDKASLTEPL